MFLFKKKTKVEVLFIINILITMKNTASMFVKNFYKFVTNDCK